MYKFEFAREHALNAVQEELCSFLSFEEEYSHEGSRGACKAQSRTSPALSQRRFAEHWVKNAPIKYENINDERGLTTIKPETKRIGNE